ncbi:hypothetical protein TREMEDRAFT_65977 [Tremella mesenterica DSM 1558]|uniref:uncharacterized protein n=1 Tax=Tremella mesenterica (strain ATCC 24925 / CBS 8224 / DSM 1558 / NBRC 9311 / NRRL Y-6157 / RJB 2259-6 / UBC 559-6) TaxID=578456 RepID=UPI00032D66E3|nr:uncharacterized protein TREMEDRAFT_65977 [Tremella mesenterica DSM 1558]EIW65892.1 hypothetical protein TREMEDRAFT_65977 [Tremella mesenterica DSM 1558]
MIVRLILALFVAPSTVAYQRQTCSSSACLDGTSKAGILAYNKAQGTAYTPGTYPSSSVILSALVPSALNQSITAKNDQVTISFPSYPVSFTEHGYTGSPMTWSSSGWTDREWKSVLLPSQWCAILGDGYALWGAVPDSKQLPSGLSSKDIVGAGSGACIPACTDKGICISTNSSTAACQCQSGWDGQQCDVCAKGFYGSSCQACDAGCDVCDDGLAGTGHCLSLPSSNATCDCLHGTCAPDGSCTCSAGWQSTSGSQQKCSTCSKGFFQDAHDNCLACPLGCTTCFLSADTDATPVCTACASNLSLSSATPATCEATGTCAEGQYWDSASSSCQGCSPSCASCTGPNPTDCLACASPRVNLAGSCVGYDVSTGVCDSSLSGLQGSFVVDNAKSKCDAGSSGTNGTCQKCDSSCSTCIGSSTYCTSCPSPLLASGGSCTTTCPSGLLPSTSTNASTCLPCSPSCSTCSSPLSASSCTSCPSSSPVLFLGRCVTHCPQDMYWDSSHSSCQACDYHCGSCSASGSSSCTSCVDGFMLERGTCVRAGCNSGGFANGLGICLSTLLTSEDESLWGLFGLPAGLAVVGLVVWWVIRERRRTREATKEFGRGMGVHHVKDALMALRLERVFGFRRFPSPEDVTPAFDHTTRNTPQWDWEAAWEAREMGLNSNKSNRTDSSVRGERRDGERSRRWKDLFHLRKHNTPQRAMTKMDLERNSDDQRESWFVPPPPYHPPSSHPNYQDNSANSSSNLPESTGGRDGHRVGINGMRVGSGISRPISTSKIVSLESPTMATWPFLPSSTNPSNSSSHSNGPGGGGSGVGEGEHGSASGVSDEVEHGGEVGDKREEGLGPRSLYPPPRPRIERERQVIRTSGRLSDLWPALGKKEREEQGWV